MKSETLIMSIKLINQNNSLEIFGNYITDH
jgi:hypothetical protein